MRKVFSALKNSFSLSSPETGARFAMPVPPPPVPPTMPVPPPPPQASLAVSGEPDLDRIEDAREDRLEQLRREVESSKDVQRVDTLDALRERNRAAMEELEKRKSEIEEAREAVGKGSSTVRDQGGTPEDIASAEKATREAGEGLDQLGDALNNSPLELDVESNAEAIPPALAEPVDVSLSEGHVVGIEPDSEEGRKIAEARAQAAGDAEEFAQGMRLRGEDVPPDVSVAADETKRDEMIEAARSKRRKEIEDARAKQEEAELKARESADKNQSSTGPGEVALLEQELEKKIAEVELAAGIGGGGASAEFNPEVIALREKIEAVKTMGGDTRSAAELSARVNELESAYSTGGSVEFDAEYQELKKKITAREILDGPKVKPKPKPSSLTDDEKRERDAIEGTGPGPLTEKERARYRELAEGRGAEKGDEHEEVDAGQFDERKVYERPKPLYLRLLKSVMGKLGPDWEDRLDAWYHDRVVEYNLGPALRAADEIETLQDEMDVLEDKVERYRGGWQKFRAAWYKSQLNRKREQLGVKEAEMRKYKSLMHEHVEQRNKYLRFMEQRYRGEMRPFEKLAEQERARLKDLRESNESLRQRYHEVSESLLDLQQEGDTRRGLRLNSGYRAKVRQAKQQLREWDKKLRENEREIAARNSRLVDAEAKADPWRAKINALAERSRDTGIPDLETPETVEDRVGGPGEIPRSRSKRPSTVPDEASPGQDSGAEGEPGTSDEPETDLSPEDEPGGNEDSSESSPTPIAPPPAPGTPPESSAAPEGDFEGDEEVSDAERERILGDSFDPEDFVGVVNGKLGDDGEVSVDELLKLLVENGKDPRTVTLGELTSPDVIVALLSEKGIEKDEEWYDELELDAVKSVL